MSEDFIAKSGLIGLLLLVIRELIHLVRDIRLSEMREELHECREELDECREELDECREELNECREELDACREKLAEAEELVRELRVRHTSPESESTGSGSE